MLARGTIVVSCVAGSVTAAAASTPTVLQGLVGIDPGALVLMTITGFGSIAALSAGAVYRGLVSRIDKQGERHDEQIREIREDIRNVADGQQSIRDTIHETRGEVRAIRDFRQDLDDLRRRSPGEPHGSPDP